MDEMPPGPALAAFLSAIDVDRVSGFDRVVVLRAHHRLAAHYQSQAYRAIAAISDSMHAIGDDFEAAESSASAEVGLALRLTRRAADSDLGFAHDLWRRHPKVGASFASGSLDQRRARVIINGVSHLPAEEAEAILDSVLPEAARLTTGQLAARIRRLCFQTDPDAATVRYREALAERRVTTESNASGTVNLFGLHLPPDEIAVITGRIDALARGLKNGGDSRTMDQLRADVLVDLLRGLIHPAARTGGGVELRVDLDTLAGLADRPGDVAGYGPVIAEIARHVAARQLDSQWRYAVTEPDTGRPVHVGTLRRRPNAQQSRIVRALYPTCVFPGCRMPATACDLDHTIPWSDSETTCIRRLRPLCRHHHTTRHLPGWIYTPLANGDHRWTTPLGHTYTTSGRSP